MNTLTEQTNARRPVPYQLAPFALILLALMVVVTALLGGSSRPDATQLVGLRTLVALFLLPVLILLTRSKLEAVRIPLMLLLCLGAWMLLQLLPLPPALWHLLPGRAPIVALDEISGMADTWRPISLVPSRGANALAGLIVPLISLLLFAATGARRRHVLLALIGIGVVNAMLGLLQLLGGEASPLYLYAITNSGSPVGFFANHNHSAVFSALVLVLIAYCASERTLEFVLPWQRVLLAAAFLLLLMVALVGQSRAGLLCGLLALGASSLMLWQSQRPKGKGNLGTGLRPGLVMIGAAVAVIVLVGAFGLADRLPALGRVTSEGAFEDLRWGLLPVLATMIGDFWLTGAGFGSFEEVYHIYETDALMVPSYVNMAHNDWAQWIIEGGLPAIAILLTAIGWIWRGLALLRGPSRADTVRFVCWLAVFAIIAFGSLVDYPLRAPLFQLAAVWLVAAFAAERPSGTAT